MPEEIEARTGVLVTHKFADPDAILVNFDFKNANTFLRIDGVLAKNLICRAPAAPSGQNALSQTTKFEMLGNFAITCARTHPKNDNTKYNPGSLGIATNIASYTISLPADSIYNNSLASDATSKIEGLQRTLATLQAQKSELDGKFAEANKKLDGIKMVPHRVMIGEHNPGGGFNFYGCYTNLDMVRDNLCKGSAQAIVTKGNSVGGHRCGYTDYVVSCLYLGK
ncbi:hypothetical protein IVA95_23475 [Bradyrhizobium sp. 157]|uniref:hypothetical protein n=1 Tax=Bradyrhizobium sp. 157 TaxID=2782631 RepID=UPI001FFBE4A5|nr:hypothetical protein [Bradyrhizobium sp. 157]MCK1640463.1 hypothetical protein [Bradyrhizobium sp. 157]